MRKVATWFYPAAVLLAATACEPPPRPVAALRILVTDGGDGPVAGAEVWNGTTPLGESSARGYVEAPAVVAPPGGVLRLHATCPRGFEYRTPTRRVPVPAGASGADGASGAGAEVIAVSLTCRSVARLLAVAIRTGDPTLAGLSLRLDGQAHGQLGADGAAHLLVERPPGSTVQVTLDTGARGRLVPQHPVHVLPVPDADSTAVIEQHFEQASPTRGRRARKRKRRAAADAPRPYRIR